MRGGKAQAWRFAKVVLATLGLLIVAVVVFGGALLRGPVLRALARQVSDELCGEVSVSGGGVSWHAIGAIAFGRPVRVALDDLRIATPAGQEVLRVERLRAMVDIDWRARTIRLPELLVHDGAFVMTSAGPDERAGVIQALHPLPKTGGTRACVEPRPQPAPARPAGGPSWTVLLPSIVLERVDMAFSFPAWGLALVGVDAGGWLAIPGEPNAPMLFEARGAHAGGGGTLRIGPRANPAVPVFSFDEVSIPRVAVESDHPEDLVLEVAEGRTGQARLSGRAVFWDLFLPAHRQTADDEMGMDLRARWTSFGDALVPALAGAGLEVPRRPRGWGDLEVALTGPYGRLTGDIALVAPDLEVRVGLENGQRLGLRTRFDRFETAAWLPPRWRDALGGRLDGRLDVRVAMGAEAADLRGRLVAGALDFERRRAAASDADFGGRLPAGISFRAGALANAPTPTGRRDHAIVRIRRAELVRGVLTVHALSAAAPGLALAGSGRARILPTTNEDAPAGDEMNVDLARLWVDLDRLVPDAAVTGALTFAGHLRGRRDRWAVTLDRRDGSLRIGDRRFAPVGPIRLLRDRQGLEVRRLQVQVSPGGVATARGRIGNDGRLDLELGAERFLFSDLLGRPVRVPAAPGPDSLGSVEVGGRVDALVTVRGSLPRPTVDGWVLVTGVRVGDRHLGDGGFEIDTPADAGTYRIRGGLLGGVFETDTLVVVGDRPRARGTVELAGFPLTPLLPAVAREVDPGISGRLRFALGGGQPPALSGALAIAGRGLDLGLRGALEKGAIDAAIAGVWHAALRLPTADISGTFDIAGRIRGRLASPRFDGRVEVRHATALLASGTVPHVRANGSIHFAGQFAGTSPGMTVETPGFEIAIGSRRTPASGTVRVGQPDRPARVEVASFDPPELGDVWVPLRGWHVSYAPPDGKIAIEDLAFDLVLRRNEDRRLNLGGRIEVESVVVDPFGESGGEGGARDDRWKEAARRVGLDLRVRGPDALRVKLPVLPDPTIGFACRVTGTAASPALAGRVRGSDPYSGLLVRAFDLFSSMDVRRCVNGQI